MRPRKLNKRQKKEKQEENENLGREKKREGKDSSPPPTIYTSPYKINVMLKTLYFNLRCPKPCMSSTLYALNLANIYNPCYIIIYTYIYIQYFV